MPHPEQTSNDQQADQADQADIAELAELLGVSHNGTPVDAVDATEGGPVHLIPPPDAVWALIAARTGVRVDARPERVRRTADTVTVAELAPELGEDGGRADPPPRSAPRIGPTPIRPRARSRRLEPLVTLVAAATLVIGLLGGAGTVLALNRWGDPEATPPAATVLSRAALTGLPGTPAAAGDVDLVETSGGMQLQVSVRRLAATDGYYEVWLADRSLKQMIPVGLIQGATATFDLPSGVRLSEYPTVDISQEPLDGDPAHSAVSVLRGTLIE